MGQEHMEVTVVCCLWGDWPHPGWGPIYVERLAAAVERNLTLSHKFICFTDRPETIPPNIETRLLKSPSWKRCLPKAYVYSPTADLEGKVIMFDLDNMIVGNIDFMVEAISEDIIVRRKFRGVQYPDGDMIGFLAGSKRPRAIWEKLVTDPIGTELETNGDERTLIRSVCTPTCWQDLIGWDKILSYKNHLRNKETLPPDVRVISFHDGGGVGGTMRQHQVNLPWVKEHWK